MIDSESAGNFIDCSTAQQLRIPLCSVNNPPCHRWSSDWHWNHHSQPLSTTVKLSLEEWRHWLERSTHLFIVLTDHKNLEYLCIAKRLNPHGLGLQFNFTLSSCPGSKTNNTFYRKIVATWLTSGNSHIETRIN